MHALVLLLLAVDPKPRPVLPTDAAHIAGLHKVLPPKEAHSAMCADVGRGSSGKSARVDTVTDLLKNRVDNGTYQPVKVAEILALPWSGLATKRYDWKTADSTKVAKYEAAPIEVTGYLVGIKEEGKEQTNCELDTHQWHDWHAWLVATEAEAHSNDKTHAIVIEITPRVRAADPSAFDKTQIQKWSRLGVQVRVDGWLLFDPDHPNDVGQSRGTTWEVHPVMKIGPAS
jgi:hypothetical protein